MDGFGGIIVLFVIIGIISSIASAAKKKSGGNQNQPPRRTLSDIQRAFMMMSGQDDDEQSNVPPAAPPQPRYVPPVQPRAAYTPSVSTMQSRLSDTPRFAYGEGASDYGSSSGEGTSDYGTGRSEGTNDYVAFSGGSLLGETAIEKEAGRRSGIGTAPSGSLRDNTPIETEAGIERYIRAAESIKEAEESINENEQDIFKEDLSQQAETVKHHAKPTLKLFADKNDYVRAVIYSEILGSGPQKRSSAR